MSKIKTDFDSIVKIMAVGDEVFEAPGYVAVAKSTGLLFWAEKPKGTAEKCFPYSHALIKLDGISWDDREEKGGDPPCPVCGKWFPSWNKVDQHLERIHKTRRGIGAVARAKRLELKHAIDNVEGKPQRLTLE
jgi:hypothetical protein